MRTQTAYLADDGSLHSTKKQAAAHNIAKWIDDQDESGNVLAAAIVEQRKRIIDWLVDVDTAERREG